MILLHIKNMVCNRCIMAVERLMDELALGPAVVGMGNVQLPMPELPEQTKSELQDRLAALGFELIDDRKGRLIEQMRNTVIQTIQHAHLAQDQRPWSERITADLPYDYKYLSNLFSAVQGITIGQYIILQKVEKAKELIVYDELTVAQIADRLGYSSAAHLSNQFKKITGMTLGQFRSTGLRTRRSLDKV